MDPWSHAAAFRTAGTDIVMVTVAAARGSVPGTVGAKMLVTAEGRHSGTVGGGRIEARALEEAAALLAEPPATAAPRLVCWNLQRDIGMTCGGEMTLLLERVSSVPPWRIAIFGAGHIVQALVPVLIPLACRIAVIDTRAEWLERLPAAPNLTRHFVAHFEEGLTEVTAASFVLSLTKGHATDVPVLREVLRRYPQIPFLGVIGSASKRAALQRDLRDAADLAPASLERIVCPLGLPVGGNDPREIAISIAAQLLARRDGVSLS